MATLVIVDGPAAGQHFALERHRLVMIGRDADCTFQILDEHVSRRHLQVKYRESEGRHHVIDAGSANGVRLNGTTIRGGEEPELADGDEIGIGRTRIVYTREDFPDAEQAMRGARMLGERRRSTIVPPSEREAGGGA